MTTDRHAGRQSLGHVPAPPTVDGRRGTHCDACGGLVGLAYCWHVVDGATVWFCAGCQGSGLTMAEWHELRAKQTAEIRARREREAERCAAWNEVLP